MPGSTSCTTCAAGKYWNGSSCATCAAGTYSLSGANGCINCAAGQYSSAGASNCIACGANTYSVGGASRCTSCPPNSTSATGAGSCTCTRTNPNGNGEIWNGSACSCPSGTYWQLDPSWLNTGQYGCFACFQGQSWNGSACVCPSGQVLYGNDFNFNNYGTCCGKCPGNPSTGQYLHCDTGVCDCGTSMSPFMYMYWDGSRCREGGGVGLPSGGS